MTMFCIDHMPSFALVALQRNDRCAIVLSDTTANNVVFCYCIFCCAPVCQSSSAHAEIGLPVLYLNLSAM